LTAEVDEPFSVPVVGKQERAADDDVRQQPEQRGAPNLHWWHCARATLLVAATFTVVAVVVGVRVADSDLDVDEVVYQSTIHGMRAGQSYYPAMRDALVAKEGAPPSQLRSVRPPTLYLLLRPFPKAAWRWLVAFPVAAATLLAGCLADRLGRRRYHEVPPGAVAAGLVGAWMVAATPLLYLHAELWGLPLVLAGLVAIDTGHRDRAACLFAAAAAFRELYLVWFVVAWALSWRRRAWWAAAACVGVLGAVHLRLASHILSAHGKEAPLGGTFHHVREVFGAFSPSRALFAMIVGTVALVAAAVGLARDHGTATRQITAISAATLLALTTVVGRDYWGLTFGPVLAVFAPLALQRSD
jgi:hypothetical protein